jgi:serine/threonine-protein kinase
LPAEEAGIENTEPPGSAPDERRRRLWPWVVGVLVLLALAGGGVAAYLLTRPKQVLVPRVVLDQVDTARTVLQNDGFGVNVITETNPRPQGIVFAQNPLANQKVDKGSTVTLTVSSGPGNVSVPPVAGQLLLAAERQIRKSGFKVKQVVQQSSNNFAAGHVINTSPPAGTATAVGSQVEIFVSTGKPLVSVPDVTGQSESSARNALQNRGFTVTTSNQTSSTVKPGQVISMSPAQGSKVASGSTVNLVIAQAPTTATIPRVKGQTQAAATTALTGAGFKVVDATKNVTDQALNGLVLSQSPRGGATAAKNSSVTIVVGHFVAPPPPTTTTTTSTTTTSTTTSSSTTTKP